MKKVLLIGSILLAIAILIAVLRKPWKASILTDGTLKVSRGGEFGILQFEPDTLVVENEGITFKNFNQAKMTVWAVSEKTQKHKFIKINEL